MGLLSLGTPMEWKDASQHSRLVRMHGIQQFINCYHRLKDRRQDSLLWGDEIEYMLVEFDEQEKICRLTDRAKDVLTALQNEMNVDMTWHPEYAIYMLESTPGSPYGSTVKDLLQVEENMKRRRQSVQSFLKPNERLLSITSFPILGSLTEEFFIDRRQTLRNYNEPSYFGKIARSIYLPDTIINEHPRFATLTRNIRTRRGRQVSINLPIFHDKNTEYPFVDPTLTNATRLPLISPAQMSDFKDGYVHMDAMGFGMGCCCLQVTFQACSIDEARRLYDQLVSLSPVTLALTAASPIHRGFLVDTDCRWDVISASVDDRTPEESGEVNGSSFHISKSRYSSVDRYISVESKHLEQWYNDVNAPVDTECFKALHQAGIDDQLANHVAHLFIRDPLVIYREKLNPPDGLDMDHFENIQSTNWNTMRFKPPPPPPSPIGWRVEFRAMEVQFTDFENAALCCFVVLLTRAILSFHLDLTMPISLVDKNMDTAQKRNAVNKGLFYFRNSVFPSKDSEADVKALASTDSLPSITSLSLAEIINGPLNAPHHVDKFVQSSEFPGLLPIIYSYLDTLHLDLETRCFIGKYLSFIGKRAAGLLQTNAGFIRDFVQKSPKYEQNSRINGALNYDLLRAIDAISSGIQPCPSLFP